MNPGGEADVADIDADCRDADLRVVELKIVESVEGTDSYRSQSMCGDRDRFVGTIVGEVNGTDVERV